MSEKPKTIVELLEDERWLGAFCTYKQLRSILHRAERHGEQKPVKLEIEEGEGQNFITVHYADGNKVTF